MRVKQFRFGKNSSSEHDFWTFTESIYSGDDQWSPKSEEYYQRSISLMQKENQAQIRGFLVYDKLRLLSRAITVILKGSNQAWVGLFEARKNESEAVQKLFVACETELKKSQIREYLAPRLDHQVIGLQVSGFDLPQSVLTPHNPSYYEAYFEQNKLSPYVQSKSFIVRKDKLKLPRLSLPWVTIRPLRLDLLEQEIETFHLLQTSVFTGKKGYTARSLEENQSLIESILPMIDPELVLLAENLQGKALGILIALPDHYYLNDPLIRARILSIATLPDFQAKGVGSLLVLHLSQVLVKKGYESAEVSWVQKDNLAPQKISYRFGADPGREFCLYKKQF